MSTLDSTTENNNNVTTTNIEEYIQKYVTEDYVKNLSKPDKTIDTFDIIVRLGVIIPLTIVASNHLGNFLPLPITCQAFLKSEITALFVSHCILFFLILFSISGNINWGEFNSKMENNGTVRFFADVAVAIAGWLFLLMFLRLRKLWMYLVLFVLLMIIFGTLSVYKNSKKEEGNREKEVNYAKAFMSSFLILVVILFLVSFVLFLKSQSEQIKAYKIGNEIYKITQPQKSTFSFFFEYLFNPEVSNQKSCVSADKDTLFNFTKKNKTDKQYSAFGKGREQSNDKSIVQEHVMKKINNIQYLPEKVQENILEIKHLINDSNVKVQKQQTLYEIWNTTK